MPLTLLWFLRVKKTTWQITTRFYWCEMLSRTYPTFPPQIEITYSDVHTELFKCGSRITEVSDTLFEIVKNARSERSWGYLGTWSEKSIVLQETGVDVGLDCFHSYLMRMANSAPLCVKSSMTSRALAQSSQDKWKPFLICPSYCTPDVARWGCEQAFTCRWESHRGVNSKVIKANIKKKFPSNSGKYG